jgi:hypothetical protein
VPDEVVARREPLGDPAGVTLEVDVLRRVGRKPGTFQNDQLEARNVGSAKLAPGRTTADDASVDEDESLHRCHKDRAYPARRAE